MHLPFFSLLPFVLISCHRDLLQVDLRLGANNFEFDPDDCEWGAGNGNLFAEDEAEITRLQSELKKTLNDIRKAEDEKLDAVKAKCELEYENKLLTEMVAVAQLDWKKNLKHLKDEKLKTEALKWELANLALAKQEEEEMDDDGEDDSDDDGETDDEE